MIRVLLVDDELGLLEVAKQCLEMQGAFHVDTAASVEEALKKLKEKEYDAVVSDLQMPRKGGLEFLEELRKSGNNIPFVLFTGKGREEVAIRALNLGADGYFNKSGHPETVYGELAHGMQQVVGKRRAEQSFLKSENKYRRLVETLREGIWVIDKDSRTTFVNPRMAEILGYDIEEMKGRHLFSFMDERGVEIAKRFLERRQQGIKEQHDSEFLRKDGTRVYTTLETSPIIDDNGNYIGALASVMDITERKRVEDALRQSKESFESLADNAFDGLLVGTQGGVHAYANKRAAEITGYTVAELLRTTVKELVHPDESEKILERYRRRIEGRAVPNPCETVIIAKDGRSVPIELAGARTIWERNPADLVFFRDITERKKAEEALRNSEGRWRSLAEGSPDHIMLIDLKFNILYINRTVPDLKREEVIGTSLFNYIPPERHRVVKDCFRRVLETGKTDHYDTEYRTKDGEVRYFNVRIGPVFQEDRVVALITSSTDVTLQKKAGEKLRESEERYRTLFQSIREGIIVRGPDDKILSANPAAAALLGYGRPEELVGKSTSELYADKNQRKAVLEDLMKKGYVKDLEVAIKKKDGTHIYVASSIASHSDKSGNILQTGFFRDITARKKAEEQIRDSEEQLSQIFMRMPSGVAVYRAVNNGEDFVFTDFNEAAERIGHVSRQEIIGKYVTEVFPGVKDFGVFEVFQRVWRSGQFEYFPAALYKDDKDEGTWRESWIYKLPNGSIVAIYNDITERKKAEEKLRVLNEKVGVVGKLTRHDVRNKLSAIVGNTYLAKKTLLNDHKALDYLREIESACRETTRVLDFAAAYESLGVEELTLIDVGKAVEEALSLISELKGVKAVNNCQGLTIMADSALTHLFFNLIENSLKHGKNVSQIKIHYEEGKNTLKLFYEDNGVGIPKANKPKLFEAGFTTGNGQGYGLPLIKKMMEIYGWTIEEEGEPGKGAKFVITIPKTHITMRARNT